MKQQIQQPRINASDITEFLCPKCRGNLFDIKYKIGKVAKVAMSNPTNRELFIVQSVYKCASRKCGHVLKEVVTTKELREDKGR